MCRRFDGNKKRAAGFPRRLVLLEAALDAAD